MNEGLPNQDVVENGDQRQVDEDEDEYRRDMHEDGRRLVSMHILFHTGISIRQASAAIIIVSLQFV